MNQESGISLHDLMIAAVRRPVLFALVTLAGLAATVAVWLLVPRMYGSEGRIFVQLGRSGVTLDPATGSRPVTVMDAPEREVRSVMEILRSRGIHEQVVDEVGADEILRSDWDWLVDWASGFLPKSSGPSEPGGPSPEEMERLLRREQAVKALGNGLKVHLEKNTSVISVYVKSRSPLLSQRIVDALMERTKEHHLQVYSASSSREFFAEKFAEQATALDEAIVRQRDFRNAHGYLSLESARATLQGVIDRIELQLVDVDAELAEALTRSGDLRGQLAAIEPMVETPAAGLESLSTEGARTRFFELKNERARLLSTYDEQHYRVQEIDRQLAEIGEELDRLPKERTATQGVVNPVHEKVQTELVTLEARLAGLKRRREALEARREAAVNQLQEFNAQELASSQLQRDIDVARNHLSIYTQKLGETKILDQLDRQFLSAVVISQPAVLMLKHVSPKGSIVLPVGAVLSGLLALLACALGLRRDRLAAERRAEAGRVFDATVLSTLPRVMSRGQIVR